ncbi:MAG: hemerythrin [Hyphomicrobiales bacterium]|nr:MAG: hemerythrin [Hyphomicrobiales bacterium]
MGRQNLRLGSWAPLPAPTFIYNTDFSNNKGTEMALFEWDDSFSVGIDMVDKQHMILVRAINLLHMAVKANSSDKLLGEIFDTLADYTDVHFTYEEQLFEIYRYPDAEEHIAQHTALLEKVLHLKRQWEAGNAEIGREVLDFLVGWLHDHILGSDRAYTAYLQQRMKVA